MDGVAEALGMTHGELRTSLRDGKTIAALAEEKGVDLETIVEAHISKIEAFEPAASTVWSETVLTDRMDKLPQMKRQLKG
ncbi:hypothetical protein [Paenibacillus chungangensis]